MNKLFPIIFFVLPLMGQNLEFPDPAFKQALLDASWQMMTPFGLYTIYVDRDRDGEITMEEARRVIQLNCGGGGFENPAGIEHFINVEGF